MADFTTNLGGIIDVDTSDRVIRYKSTDKDKRGAIANKGANTVYIAWGAVTAVATDAEGVDKAYIAAGEAIRVPRKCNFFAVKTAAGSSKLIHVED